MAAVLSRSEATRLFSCPSKNDPNETMAIPQARAMIVMLTISSTKLSPECFLPMCIRGDYGLDVFVSFDTREDLRDEKDDEDE